MLGTNAENNNFTIDYSQLADTYTITDTNTLTAGAGAVQVDANTVTVDGGLLNNRINVRTFAGTNSVVVNDNGGSLFGNEGLRVNNDAGTEAIRIGDGGVRILGAATIASRGQIVLLGDTIELDGTLQTFDQAIRLGNTEAGSTIAVSDSVEVRGQGVLGQVAFDSEVVQNNGRLLVSGQNVFFNEAVSLTQIDLAADNLATFDDGLDLTSFSLSRITAHTQIDITGTSNLGTMAFNSADIRIDDVTAQQLNFAGGTIDFGGTVTPASSFSTVRFSSRSSGGTVRVFNAAAAPNDPVDMNVDLSDLAAVADFEVINIGQTNVDVVFVGDNDNSTRLLPPTVMRVFGQTITLGEGIDTGTGTDATSFEMSAGTITVANNRPFAGEGRVVVSASSFFGNSLDVNGRFVSRGGTSDPDLLITGQEVTFNDEVGGGFASIEANVNTLNLPHFTALTSEGDVTLTGFGAGSGGTTVNSNGGIFADGSIIIDGDLNMTGDNTLIDRVGGNVIQINGNVIGNGNRLQARGSSAGDVGAVNLFGAVTDVSGLSILRALEAIVDRIEANGAASGSDVQIRVANSLQLRGDITAPDTIDLRFGEAELPSGDITIAVSGDSTDRIQLIGDLDPAGNDELTVDIGAGSFVRVGNDGGITVTQV